MTQKLVVIGNGMAPGRVLETSVRGGEGPTSTVTIFNAEPRGELRPDHAVPRPLRREDLRGHHHPR